jgi:hypothetical protein
VRLDLGTVARLRTAGVFDLNALARDGGGLARFVGDDLAGVLHAAWVTLGGPGDLAGWLTGQTGEDAARHRAAFAAALAEFMPEREGDDAPRGTPPEHTRRGLWVERLGWEMAGVCGVDGSRLSLRELVWMARERRRFLGELAAWHMSWVVGHIPFVERPPNPADVNPYKGPAPAKDAATRELERWQKDARLLAMAGQTLKPLVRA